MSWDAIIMIIAQYGFPLAEKLWAKWSSGNAPTQADWNELRDLAKNTARARMMAALARAGIDPTSAQGVALLALTPE